MPKQHLKAIAVFAALVAGVAGAIWYSDLYLGTIAPNIAHRYLLPLALLAVTAVLVAIAGGMHGKSYRDSWLFVAAGTGLVGLVVTISMGVYGAYAADKAYVANVKVIDAALGSYAERSPWTVAKKRVSSDKGDLIGDALSPRYFPDEEVYTTLVAAPNVTGGYAGVVEQTIDTDGATTARTCAFNNGGRDGYRMGGMFDGSLTREIAHHDRKVIVRDGDVYGYCDGDVPVVVAPMTKIVGAYPAIETPAGVALYRGDTERVEVHYRLGELDLRGPVYPISLASRQREALVAAGDNVTLWTWMRSRSGWTEATTEDDPNGSNSTEFALKGSVGGEYVTPMTPRPKQDQPRIGAYARVSIDDLQVGSRNQVTLVKVPTEARRQSNGVIVDQLKSFYSEADFGWAQGLKVFEMVPAKAGTWKASLGFDKTVKFTVTLNADGSSCLADGHGKVVRCVDDNGLVLTDETPDTSGGGTAPSAGSDLASLSNSELAALQKAVTAEMLHRMDENFRLGAELELGQ